MMTNLQLAQLYAKLGWHVLPVWSVDSAGRCRCGLSDFSNGHSAGKHPQALLVPRGHLDASSDLEIITRWFSTDPAAGIGISLAASGLLALDIDPRNGGWDSLAKFEADYGPLVSGCMAITQSGGEHRLFLAEPEMSFPASLGPGLDLKHHGYICVEGTLGPNGNYRWISGANPLDGGTPSELPSSLRALSRRSDNAKEIRPGSVIAAPELYRDLRLALQAIPPDVEYPEWLKILHAMSRLHNTDLAREIAREWSSASTKAGHTLDAFDRKWSSVMKENSQVSYKTIFYLSQQHAKGLESVPIVRGNPLAHPIQPFSDEEAAEAKLEPHVLVENYLYADLRNLIAAGGVGKTTMLLHEAVCGALGRQIWGNNVPKPFTTVFITKEDPREILLARIREIMKAMDLSHLERQEVYRRVFVVDLSGTSFKLAVIAGGQIDPHIGNLDALVEHCRPISPDRIIFDPLVSFTVGESRVNEAEQGIVEAARYLMRQFENIAVDIVHHTGKANARNGATDQYAGRSGSSLPDGCRMVAVATPCPDNIFFEATGQPLDKSRKQTGLRISFPKLSYAALPNDKYIRRQEFDFQVVDALSEEQRAELQQLRKEAGMIETSEEIKASIISALRNHQSSSDPLDRFPSRSRVLEMTGVSGKTAKRRAALKELIEDDFLIEKQLGDYELSFFQSRKVLSSRNTYVSLSNEEI